MLALLKQDLGLRKVCSLLAFVSFPVTGAVTQACSVCYLGRP